MKLIVAVLVLVGAVALDAARWYAAGETFGWWNAGYMFIGAMVVSAASRWLKS